MHSIVKRLIIFTAGASLMSIGFALPSGATQSPVVGNWAAHDHGQGCWGGGNLRADGTGDGGGNCSDGVSVASLTPVSWSYTDSTHVDLVAYLNPKKGTDFGPAGYVDIVVPINTDTPVDLGMGTFAKVTIK